MGCWDTSALVKLYATEADSAQFQGLTAPGVPLVIAHVARYEAHAVFRRREAEGSLPQGETTMLLQDISTDVSAGKITVQADDAEVEKRFGEVLEACLSQTTPVSSERTTRCISPRHWSLANRNLSPPMAGNARQRC